MGRREGVDCVAEVTDRNIQPNKQTHEHKHIPATYLGEAHGKTGLDVLAGGEGGVQERDAVREHGHLQTELLLLFWGLVGGWFMGCGCVSD